MDLARAYLTFAAQRRRAGALRHRPHRGPRRQRRVGARPRRRRRGHRPRHLERRHLRAAAGDRVGHRHRRRHRPPGSREDGDDAGQRRRLVRRLRPRLRRRRLDGLSRRCPADGQRARAGGHRRLVPGPDLAAVHVRGHRGSTGRGLPGAARRAPRGRTRPERSSLQPPNLLPGGTTTVTGSGFDECVESWSVAVDGTPWASPPETGSDASDRRAALTIGADAVPGEYRVVAHCDSGAGPEVVAFAVLVSTDRRRRRRPRRCRRPDDRAASDVDDAAAEHDLDDPMRSDDHDELDVDDDDDDDDHHAGLDDHDDRVPVEHRRSSPAGPEQSRSSRQRSAGLDANEPGPAHPPTRQARLICRTLANRAERQHNRRCPAAHPSDAGLLEGPAGEHPGQVAAVLGGGVEVGRRVERLRRPGRRRRPPTRRRAERRLGAGRPQRRRAHVHQADARVAASPLPTRHDGARRRWPSPGPGG